MQARALLLWIRGYDDVAEGYELRGPLRHPRPPNIKKKRLLSQKRDERGYQQYNTSSVIDTPLYQLRKSTRRRRSKQPRLRTPDAAPFNRGFGGWLLVTAHASRRQARSGRQSRTMSSITSTGRNAAVKHAPITRFSEEWLIEEEENGE